MTTIHTLRFNVSVWAAFGDCLDMPDWMLSTMYAVGVR